MTNQTLAKKLLSEQDEYVEGRHALRVIQLAAVIEAHPGRRITLVRCSDERTGVRFGNAACRRGRAWKIGQTGSRMVGPQNGRRLSTGYQLWAVVGEES